MSDDEKLDALLSRFHNEDLCLEALEACHGDLDRAGSYVIAMGYLAVYLNPAAKEKAAERIRQGQFTTRCHYDETKKRWDLT